MFKSSVELVKYIKSTSSNRTEDEKEEGIVFATDVTKKRPSKRKTGSDVVHFIRVRIGRIVAEKAGLKAGDKVELQWDEERRLGLIAPHPEGWVLNGLKRVKEPETGDYQPLQLRYTWHRGLGLPSIYQPKLCREVVVIKGDLGDTSIQFVFPEGTSFGRLSTPPKTADQEGEPNNVVQYNRRSTDKKSASG